ncbi:MAG TPA: amino acid deaminase/aldolase [Polyangiaceae bacterium LLY-WYZ-15_(1-7)]|nr:amino acid aldolase [Sandaracinus sp.]HJL02607.1 amino acid deaminase/aldolase [Polyangiaceae bacterium LLY-WYZ-15_(1-7)]MBJ72069.1 amino acid aldolase [Sandaracinus sp.]HJL11277.1 amino acid deaminase/aldolase [Polyangiaceae bacterium LLY-WYZ-15_(1-7)]HJL24811.1 amino acid deaminase/aldolase [Polyangiaceae bacterium LLY-WYZ-15_(1-7)]
MPSYATYREAVRGRRLPLAFCDLDLLERNLDALARRARGNPIRVASKSVRCVEVLRRTLAHEGFAGVMAYTAAEAAHLADHGFDDLLVAYPTVEPSEIRQALEHVAAGKTITLMVDDAEQVRRLSALAAERDVELPLCLDVDMALPLPGLFFGVRRSPIRTAAQARRLGQAIHAASHVRLEGVMGYEAQIAGLPDGTPNRAFNLFVRQLKKRSIRDLRRRRGAVVDALRADGHALRFVNGGGTGSLESTAGDPSVTESTAGSGLYAPGLFDEFAGFKHLPAAGFAVPVVRRPGPGYVACHGGGYVASGGAGKDKLPKPYLPAGLALLDQEGAGEVQTPLKVEGPITPAIGDPVFFRHAKAGELCERFETLLLLRGGAVVGEAPTYRGEGKCFL